LRVRLEPGLHDADVVSSRHQVRKQEVAVGIAAVLSSLFRDVVGQTHTGADNDGATRVDYRAADLSSHGLSVACRHQGQQDKCER
jgi:hypothetical protein